MTHALEKGGSTPSLPPPLPLPRPQMPQLVKSPPGVLWPAKGEGLCT